MDKVNVIQHMNEIRNILSYATNIGFFFGAGTSCFKIATTLLDFPLPVEPNTGRNRPLLIAYEEAHSYLGKNETIYARNAVEKIFKEGRKFGLGAVVISQRPSELSETILAQVGTFIALRLTNSSDQSIVKSMAPDNMNSLISLLPSLRIGEAVIVGEAINIPTRVRLPLQSPRPDSSDPELVSAWMREYNSDDDYKMVVTKIREQHF
jgi:uncharacterized protein